MNLTRVPLIVGLSLTLSFQVSSGNSNDPPKRPYKTIYKIDVSSPDATPGKPGLSYKQDEYNIGGSAKGPDGGDAEPSDPTLPGGDIEIDLTEIKDEYLQVKKGFLKLEGKIRRAHSDQNHKEKISTEIEIGTEGHIELDTHAGKPADSERGGDAAMGDSGDDGDPATETREGTDGEKGGTGGKAGNASKVTPPQKAGDILVRAPVHKTEWLMLLKTYLQGSLPAKGNIAGKRGPGGPGGTGGPAKYWTTRVASGKDAQGNTIYTEIPHYMQGGEDGDVGDLGEPGKDEPGVPAGPDGKQTIQLLDETGKVVQTADQRYDLVLLDYQYVNENEDGINEPGERVIVSKIRVKNIGKLPTPMNLAAEFFIQKNNWVLPDEGKLLLPKVLQPGDEYFFENEKLYFTIAEPKEANIGSALVKTGELNPKSSLLNRPFENFEKVTNFEIRFPIEMTPIVGPSSMERGGKVKISFIARNISKKNFGSMSDLKREIAVELQQMVGGVDPKNVHFVTRDGKRIQLDKEGWFQEFTSLTAKGTKEDFVLIEGFLEVDENAPTYEVIDLKGNLKLGSINAPSLKKVIQVQGLKITVAESYKKTEDSGLLLIVNNTTKRDEILAWKKLAEDMGQKLDIWDLSLNGYLALTEGLANGSLAQDFQGKTMILLNNSMRSVGQGEELPLDYVRRRDFLKVASEHGIRFYIVHPSEVFDASALLVPTGDKTKTHASISAYLKALQENRDANVEAKKLGELVEEIEHTGWRLIFKPKKKNFLKKLKSLLKKTKEVDPASRTYIVHHFESEILQKKYLGLLKQWKIGSIEVRRTLDEGTNSIVAIDPVLNITEGRPEMVTSEFILGGENRLGLLMSLTFPEKLKLLKRSAQGELPNLPSKLLFQAIAFDLAEEQLALLKTKKNAGVTRKTLLKNLPNLNLLSKFKLEGQTLPAHFLDPLSNLVVSVQNLAPSATSWWEWITPGRRYPKVASAVESVLWNWAKSLYPDSAKWKEFTEYVEAKKKDYLNTPGRDRKVIIAHPSLSNLNQTFPRLYGFIEPLHVRNTEDLFEAYKFGGEILEREEFNNLKDAAVERDKILDTKIKNNLLMINECLGKTLEK